MAKKSSIERNKKRMRLVEKYAARRAELKKTLSNPNVSDEDFFIAQRALTLLPRNSSRVRVRNRCAITGRARASMRKFGVSRIQFREMASAGLLPGITKSSW
ncbi:MAG: 30S ribosomal protein S14 [Verrucomicrobia bacterium GWF2_51_19]|nr:MAG: 30S ribosomal protein S14 [Verrucomicrobia bacterium GWF2_51_19]HCJ12584.1 30S ribosomal protein S14 [Opitutae bacterium]